MATLRERTGTADMESRPSVVRDHKNKWNIFQRINPVTRRIFNPGFVGNQNNNTNNASQSRYHSSTSTLPLTASLSTVTTPSSGNATPGRSTSSSLRKVLSNSKHRAINTMAVSMSLSSSSSLIVSPLEDTASPATSTDVLFDWLETDCPKDLLPHILAYTGPQVTSTLSHHSEFWNHVTNQETTWRILCEELYKWKQGEEVPTSWKDYYKYNPCVPVDYSTIHAALKVVDMAQADTIAQPKTVRILLRPGRYILREAITIGTNNNNSGNLATNTVDVAFETMEHFPSMFHPSALEAAICSPPEPEPSKRRKTTIRSIFQCRTVDVEDDETTTMGGGAAVGGALGEMEFRDIPPDMFLENNVIGGFGREPGRTSTTSTSVSQSDGSVKRATLMLRTRRHNEPLIRVSQGSCTIRNMELKHICYGTDIWNGNAAVQLQPPMGPDDQPLMVFPAPKATLDRVEITSVSGRGIVNIDGGSAIIINSYIHDCAATGIYVGGPGSRADIVRTDVVQNGMGNTQHRRGIARGHSGIYLEQGHASIVDCNISRNSLTGISAVSPDNAVLVLEDSDLVSNGTFQLEMPALGTNAHRNSTLNNNNLAPAGVARPRSGLIEE